MKILVLCDRYPYPLEQGLHLRLFNLIKYLPNHCKADLFAFGEEHVPEALSDVFNNVFPYKRPTTANNNNLFKRIARLFNPKYLVTYNQKVGMAINDLLSKRQYDIILSTTGMLPNIEPNLSIPVVVDVIDDAVLEWWREFKVASTIQLKFKAMLYTALNYLFEKRYLSNRYTDACFFTSEIDAKVFKKICWQTRTEVIQNGVDGDFYHPRYSATNKNIIIFEGNMSFPPNIDGATYFCKEIFPLIISKNRNIKLLLVGKSPAAEILDLASDNVVVTGFVDDIRPYIISASVFVCPLRKGGGIKNKLLQAWSMGKACVATSFSIGGLEATDGENILVRDSKESFAQAVVDLLDDPDTQFQLGHNARKTIENYYTWKKKSSDLCKLLEECIIKKKISKTIGHL